MNDALRCEIDLAVGEVVRNVTNFPEAVQPRLLGQDMSPLREAIVAKIEERIDRAYFAAAERLQYPVASVEVEFRDVSPEVVSLITGGIPLTDEDRIEAAARSIAGLEPGEEWPTNDDLGGSVTGTRDDEYRDNIRDTARAALKAAGVIA